MSTYQKVQILKEKIKTTDTTVNIFTYQSPLPEKRQQWGVEEKTRPSVSESKEAENSLLILRICLAQSPLRFCQRTWQQLSTPKTGANTRSPSHPNCLCLYLSWSGQMPPGGTKLQSWSDQIYIKLLDFCNSRPARGVSCGSASKESTCNAGDLGAIPGLGKSPGEGKGYPLQYSGLDRIVHGVAKSWTRLSDFHRPARNNTRLIFCVMKFLELHLSNYGGVLLTTNQIIIVNILE